jgi:hypothetical protein
VETTALTVQLHVGQGDSRRIRASLQRILPTPGSLVVLRPEGIESLRIGRFDFVINTDRAGAEIATNDHSVHRSGDPREVDYEDEGMMGLIEVGG